MPSADSLRTSTEAGLVIRGLLCEIANDPVVGAAYQTHVLAKQREALLEAVSSTTGGPAAVDHDVEREIETLLAKMYFQFIFAPGPRPLAREPAPGRTRTAARRL